MKRPFSLLEVAIGLALTAILITALFSGFRQLMLTGVHVQRARNLMHPGHLMQLRLNQIFESVTSGEFFFTDQHAQAKGEALYFTFDNGINRDPELCNEVDAVLFCTNEKKGAFCLLIKDQIKEFFIDDVHQLFFQFFDPKKNIWSPQWKEKHLPSMLQIRLDETLYTFTLPRAEQKVVYP